MKVWLLAVIGCLMSTTLWAQDNQYEQVMADIMQLQRDSSQLVADTLSTDCGSARLHQTVKTTDSTGGLAVPTT